MKYPSHKNGFALIVGVLLASVLLSLTMVMFSISLKHVSLSTAGRNSQLALYAADTALECALYWDLKHGAFVTPPQYVENNIVAGITHGTATTIDCVGDSAIALEKTADFIEINGDFRDAYITSFRIDRAPVFASVTVTKWMEADVTNTKIESRGYNVASEYLNSPLAVERGLEVHYP